MNQPSRRSFILFLVYLVIALGLTIIGIRKQSPAAVPEKQEIGRAGVPTDKL